MNRPDVAASIEILFALPPDQRPAWLTAHPAEITDAFVEALKARADDYCGSDIQAALRVAELIKHAAALTDRDDFRAVGLMAEGNARLIGYAEYEAALACFDAALEIFRRLGRDVEAARAMSGRLYPLARLGRLAEAYDDFDRARKALLAAGDRSYLANTLHNFGTLLGYLRADREALARFDEAESLLTAMSAVDPFRLANVQQNRGVLLRHLGRFDESIQASTLAANLLDASGHYIESARARQNLGVTYVEMGDYSRGLELLDRARDAYVAQHLVRSAMLLDVMSAECELDIGRSEEALRRLSESSAYFESHSSPLESGQAYFLRGLAFMARSGLDEALVAFREAEARFRLAENRVLQSRSLRYQANISARLALRKQARDLADRADTLLAAEHPLEVLRAKIDMATLALELGADDEADEHLDGLERALQDEPIPLLRFDFHRIKARIAQLRGHPSDALRHFTLAMDELDLIRGRLMAEFASDFLIQKEAIFADAVRIAIDCGDSQRALELIERGKSRAMIDVLGGRLSRPVRSRRQEDEPLVAELNQLIGERDRLLRRWRGSDDEQAALETGETSARQAVLSQIAGLEQSIEQRWRRLLIRGDRYASDAALVRIVPEAIGSLTERLPADTAVLEYFSTGDRFLIYVITGSQIKVREVQATWSDVRPLLRYLQMNLTETPRRATIDFDGHLREAKGILTRLHNLLIAPIADYIGSKRQLVVIPHADLYRLPFQALYDGQHYLVEDFDIGYLPSLGTLGHLRTGSRSQPKVAVFGRSDHGRLPASLTEALQVGEIWDVAPKLETEATVDEVVRAASRCQILHLATHGSFRADSPLFSSIECHDGELTALRIFNEVHMDGTLVVLSACESGQGVVGGGDEMQGLRQAFLYRGASALVMTLWEAADETSAPIMAQYHALLCAGEPKVVALSETQRAFLSAARASAQRACAHPFFWAPFIHVGDLEPIKEVAR